ncbi:PAS domain S-box protein [bacterium]|nr:MAG: PAS domain S-box protein [bacterium]
MIDENLLPARLQTIVEAALRGLSDKGIAAELNLSVHTIDTHWRRLRDIFQAANRAETIAKYLAWRHEQTLTTLQREVEERRMAEERLQEANERLTEAIKERDKLYIQVAEAAAQQNWKMIDERERLVKTEMAAEASGTILYEGEFGGGWRKYWVTRNMEQLGYSVEDFVSGAIRVSELIPAEDLVSTFSLTNRAVERGDDSVVTYYRIRAADGSLRWFRDRMTLIRDEHGQPVRYFGAGTDVTELAERLDSSFLLHPRPDER